MGSFSLLDLLVGITWACLVKVVGLWFRVKLRWSRSLLFNSFFLKTLRFNLLFSDIWILSKLLLFWDKLDCLFILFKFSAYFCTWFKSDCDLCRSLQSCVSVLVTELDLLIGLICCFFFTPASPCSRTCLSTPGLIKDDNFLPFSGYLFVFVWVWSSLEGI